MTGPDDLIEARPEDDREAFNYDADETDVPDCEYEE